MTHRDGFPRFSDGPMLLNGAHGFRCPASLRHALLAESLGKPSLWVIINAPWYQACHRQLRDGDRRVQFGAELDHAPPGDAFEHAAVRGEDPAPPPRAFAVLCRTERKKPGRLSGAGLSCDTFVRYAKEWGRWEPNSR